jgi:hypothetical protein
MRKFYREVEDQLISIISIWRRILPTPKRATGTVLMLKLYLITYQFHCYHSNVRLNY